VRCSALQLIVEICDWRDLMTTKDPNAPLSHRETELILKCDVTLENMWHDSFQTRRDVRSDSFSDSLVIFVCGMCDLTHYMCDMSHRYAWHDPFLYWLVEMCDVTHFWLFFVIIMCDLTHYMCDVSHSYVSSASFICVTCLNCMYDIWMSYSDTYVIWHACRDSFSDSLFSFLCVILCDLAHYMCDLSHWYVKSDSLICVTCLNCMYDIRMTYNCM